mmetsp:Transcript_6623/g.16539  ORF Transcript_6623/g.16539 Transcript_6623/m.16539 type:complete len:90 (+) Transcript_6623:1629-1898(+)
MRCGGQQYSFSPSYSCYDSEERDRVGESKPNFDFNHVECFFLSLLYSHSKTATLLVASLYTAGGGKRLRLRQTTLPPLLPTFAHTRRRR